MNRKHHKAALFGVVGGAIIALFATAKAQADTIVFDPVAPVTEGQSGTITGTFTTAVVFPEQIVIALPTGSNITFTGDSTDTWTSLSFPAFTCARVCTFSGSFNTGVDVGETDADFGTTTFTLAAFVGTTTGPEVADNLVTLTVNDTPIPAALPLFATGLGGLGLLGWRRKRKAQEHKSGLLKSTAAMIF